MTHAEQWCRMTAKFQEMNHPPHLTPAQYLLAHGASMTERRWTERDWRGLPRNCYHNAYTLARRRPTLRYVEGFATGLIPVEHAWCIDAEGRVIDPTWINEYTPDYFGMTFDLETVRRVRRVTKALPVLWSWWAWHKVFKILTAQARAK